MTDEKWELMVEQIRRKFKVSEHTTSEPDPRDRAVRELLVFEGPAGPMKLERVTRPLVLEKKPIYSNRAGSGSFPSSRWFSPCRTRRARRASVSTCRGGSTAAR